ncbi:MAG: Fur family transcriptional regulator [Polyangiaceae bacterium]
MATSSKGKKAADKPVRVFQELLRARGLRSTAPRVAVLQYLHDSPEPNSHAELFTALADKGFDRATIYRNLMDLTEVGVVSRTDLGDHVWRFELKQGVAGTSHNDRHPHFVCVDCGEVSCLPGVSVDVKGPSRLPKAISKHTASVQFKGRCDGCT